MEFREINSCENSLNYTKDLKNIPFFIILYIRGTEDYKVPFILNLLKHSDNYR